MMVKEDPYRSWKTNIW